MPGENRLRNATRICVVDIVRFVGLLEFPPGTIGVITSSLDSRITLGHQEQ